MFECEDDGGYEIPYLNSKQTAWNADSPYRLKQQTIFHVHIRLFKQVLDECDHPQPN